MSDLIRKALLSGLGLANLTRDAVQKTAEDLVRKSNLSEEEGRRLVKDLHRRSAKAQRDLEKTMHTAVNKLLKNLNLAIVHDLPKSAGKRAAKRGRTSRSAKDIKA
jgi:polyhydroxyalkanoate synthesis regulator phasin